MNTKTTFLLLICAIGLLAFIWFYEQHQPGTREARELAQQVLQIDRDQLDGIQIMGGDQELQLRRVDGEWKLLEPLRDRADTAAVNQLINALELLRVESRITPAELRAGEVDLAEIGLMDSTRKIRLLSPESAEELEFGDETAIDGRVYARVAGDETVYIVGDNVLLHAFQPVAAFRDQKLSPLPASRVASVELTAANGAIELQRDPRDWSLVKPLKARADTERVDDLLAELANARIGDFLSEDDLAEVETGLDNPRGTITLRGDLEDEVVSLELGAEALDQPGYLYLRLADRDAVVLAPAQAAVFLELDPNALRDRRLLALEEDALDRITFEGDQTTILHRQEDGWEILELESMASSAEVRRFLQLIQNEEVVEFVADSAADLEPYGLDEPRMRLVFSSFATENVPEAGAGEHPLVTVEFGDFTEDDELVYARLVEEPYIVAVSADIFDEISDDPTVWQSLTVFNFERPDLHRIEVTRNPMAEPAEDPDADEEEENGESEEPGEEADEESDGEGDEEPGVETVVLERVEGGRDWRVIEGEGVVEETNLESFLGSLAKLRAVRWVSADDAGQGLEQPWFLISFTAHEEDYEVAFGTPNEIGQWHARASVKPGVFLVSGPDQELLTLPLVVPGEPGEEPEETPEDPPAEEENGELEENGEPGETEESTEIDEEEPEEETDPAEEDQEMEDASGEASDEDDSEDE